MRVPATFCQSSDDDVNFLNMLGERNILGARNRLGLPSVVCLVDMLGARNMLGLPSGWGS